MTVRWSPSFKSASSNDCKGSVRTRPLCTNFNNPCLKTFWAIRSSNLLLGSTVKPPGFHSVHLARPLWSPSLIALLPLQLPGLADLDMHELQEVLLWSVMGHGGSCWVFFHQVIHLQSMVLLLGASSLHVDWLIGISWSTILKAKISTCTWDHLIRVAYRNISKPPPSTKEPKNGHKHHEMCWCVKTKPLFYLVLHPWNSTWNLEMMVSNRNLLFHWSIFWFHLCFGGCILFLCSFISWF